MIDLVAKQSYLEQKFIYFTNLDSQSLYMCRCTVYVVGMLAISSQNSVLSAHTQTHTHTLEETRSEFCHQMKLPLPHCHVIIII